MRRMASVHIALEKSISMDRVTPEPQTVEIAVMPQASYSRAPHADAQPFRQPYYKPHTSLGATGHWVKTAGLLAPLVIGEFVKDPDQRWRFIRIAAVATALVSEAMWTHRITKEREEARERERECRAQY